MNLHSNPIEPNPLAASNLYDISPTAPLTGVHLKGTVTRRFLISYAVAPDLLAPQVPPGAELAIFNGLAWVSACFVNIEGMRPSFGPSWAGTGFNYLIHRTRARLPYPDGRLRESVLVLEANINRPILGWLARKSMGIRFRSRDITLTEDSKSWTLKMTSGSEVLFDADIYKSSVGTDIGSSSRFASAREADGFLLGVAFGGEWEQQRERVRLFAETHDPWKTFVGQCSTKCNAYLASLGAPNVEADHVITMTDIPHYFAFGSIAVPCRTVAQAAP